MIEMHDLTEQKGEFEFITVHAEILSIIPVMGKK